MDSEPEPKPDFDKMKIDTYSTDDVMDFIDRGQLHIHALREKDKATRKGIHWKLFHAINDSSFEVVRNFFFCPTCNFLFHIVTKISGTNDLTRHGCFRMLAEATESTKTVIQKQKKVLFKPQVALKTEVPETQHIASPDRKWQVAQRSPVTPQSPVAQQSPAAPKSTRVIGMAPDKISNGQMEILKIALIGYGDICNRFGPLSPDELCPLIPNEWSSASWYEFVYIYLTTYIRSSVRPSTLINFKAKKQLMAMKYYDRMNMRYDTIAYFESTHTAYTYLAYIFSILILMNSNGIYGYIM